MLDVVAKGNQYRIDILQGFEERSNTFVQNGTLDRKASGIGALLIHHTSHAQGVLKVDEADTKLDYQIAVVIVRVLYVPGVFLVSSEGYV